MQVRRNTDFTGWPSTEGQTGSQHALEGKTMSLNRYEHETIKHKIDGYMIPSRDQALETREQQFERAKAELLGHLKRQIEQVEGFTIADMSKKVS